MPRSRWRASSRLRTAAKFCNSCDSSTSESPAGETGRGDADLMGELRYWMSTMRVAGLISRDRIALAEQLLERIMAEPGSARVSQAP